MAIPGRAALVKESELAMITSDRQALQRSWLPDLPGRRRANSAVSDLKIRAIGQKSAGFRATEQRVVIDPPPRRLVHGTGEPAAVPYGSVDREQSHVLFNILLIYS